MPVDLLRLDQLLRSQPDGLQGVAQGQDRVRLTRLLLQLDGGDHPEEDCDDEHHDAEIQVEDDFVVRECVRVFIRVQFR